MIPRPQTVKCTCFYGSVPLFHLFLLHLSVLHRSSSHSLRPTTVYFLPSWSNCHLTSYVSTDPYGLLIYVCKRGRPGWCQSSLCTLMQITGAYYFRLALGFTMAAQVTQRRVLEGLSLFLTPIEPPFPFTVVRDPDSLTPDIQGGYHLQALPIRVSLIQSGFQGKTSH